MRDAASSSLSHVRRTLRHQLADYLRKARGEMSYAKFGRRLGISDSTLQRLEMAEQNITIDTLETLLRALKCRISDIFQ